MNLISFKNVDGEDVELQIPESAHELKFGQLIALETPGLSNVEVLSILANVPVETLYGAKDIEGLNKIAKVYIDLFTINLNKLDLTKMPKKIMIRHENKPVTVMIAGRLSIEPVGAAMRATEAITNEIHRHIDLYGEDKWRDNFQPSLKMCGKVVDAFLYYPVTRERWDNDVELNFSDSLSAADALIIGKYFFNSFPKLNAKKVSKLSKIFSYF